MTLNDAALRFADLKVGQKFGIAFPPPIKSLELVKISDLTYTSYDPRGLDPGLICTVDKFDINMPVYLIGD